MNIIDRRANPHGKSLANRQRFIERAKGEAKRAVADALKHRKLSDLGNGEKVSIPSKGIAEPTFHRAAEGGRREHVAPGNREYVAGDTIARPPASGGGGRSKASREGEGEDSFEFALTRDEFLQILFDEMELPDLVKTSLNEAETFQLARAGHSVNGNPSNLNLGRTMRHSLARRISLGRPKRGEMERIEALVAAAEAEGDAAAAGRWREELDALRRRARRIAYIDPSDIRYNLFQKQPRPNTQAVMFCLMDVSGSMTEHMKDLAKRFFLLLHIFLTRRYKKVDLVFIRHTSMAQEVDEDTFFHGRETGGTVVSSALEEFLRAARDRYALEAWNIYVAQASDGDNVSDDNARCVALLEERILPMVQYFAYLEVSDRIGGLSGGGGGKTNLWRTYAEVKARHSHFEMKRVADAAQIFPVFHELFGRDRQAAQKA